jgi:dipeptidyl aminopeptidase/acylaminoacyl peptidase
MVDSRVRHALALWLTGSILFACSGDVAQSQVEHGETFEDSETLKSADHLQLSPDGKFLIYTLDGVLWLVSTQRGSLPQKLTNGTLPTWSPNGKLLAYYSKESGTFQLWVRDMNSGRTEQITNLEGGISPNRMTLWATWGTDPLSYRWSPDGAKLVFASQVVAAHQSSDETTHFASKSESDVSTNDPLVLTNSTPSQWTLSGLFEAGGFSPPEYIDGNIRYNSALTKAAPRKVNQLFIAYVNSKKVVQLTEDDGMYFNEDWSPDGRSIVYTTTEGRPVGLGVDTVSFAINVALRDRHILSKSPNRQSLPSWSPDGKWIAYVGGEHGEMGSLYVRPSIGGAPTNLTSMLDRSLGVYFGWSPDSESIVFNYGDGVTTTIAQVNLRTRQIQKIVGDEPASRDGVSISRSGTIAWQQSDGTRHGVIYVLSPGSKIPYALIDLNPQIQQWRLGRQEIVRWRNTRGEELEGVLIKPVGYRPDRTYPLIVDAYPEQKNDFKAWPLDGNQMWASKGYAVFWPDAQAPHVWQNFFKSKSFNQAAKGPKGWDITFENVMSGVDELVRRGIVDPERIGLFGFSNGGGIVNYLVTKTNRFKCAVSVAGVYPDWLLPFFLNKNTSVPELAGVTPWQDPEAYIQLSAVFHLDKVNTPMLLADGDNDSWFLLGMIEMYNGLRHLGKDVTLLRYPNQGHGFEGSAMKDFWQRENDFFDKYLKPEPN